MEFKIYLAGHNKKEFAKKLGIGLSTLYNYSEGNRLPPLDIVEKITELTGKKVTMKDILKTWRDKHG